MASSLSSLTPQHGSRPYCKQSMHRSEHGPGRLAHDYEQIGLSSIDSSRRTRTLRRISPLQSLRRGLSRRRQQKPHNSDSISESSIDFVPLTADYHDQYNSVDLRTIVEVPTVFQDRSVDNYDDMTALTGFASSNEKSHLMTSEKEVTPKHIIVHQDMYADGLPPTYEKNGFATLSDEKQKTIARCSRCGTPRRDGSELENGKATQPCARCRKGKSMPPNSFPSQAMAAASGARTSSQATSNSLANTNLNRPESDLESQSQNQPCTCCGRVKRVNTTTKHKQAETIRAGVIPSIQTNGIPIAEQELESAVSRPNTAHAASVIPSRAGRSFSFKRSFSTTRSPSGSRKLQGESQPSKADEASTPVRKPAPPRRRSSLSGMLRSLSFRRNRNKSRSISPSAPKIPSTTNIELSTISSPAQSTLRPTAHTREPSFSKGDDAWPLPQASSTSDRPTPLHTQSSPATSKLAQAQRSNLSPPSDPTMVGITPDQRPNISRFKSLRQGYNRASSGLSRSASTMARSTSLRRLESVRRAPQLWYRDDVIGEDGESYVVVAY